MSDRATRILVTGSSLFFSCRLIHDLGKRGVSVTAADSLRFSAGKASRYTARGLRLPRISDDPGRYLETLLKELRSRPYDLLLPTFEESLLLAEYQADLRPHVRLFLPSFSAMKELHHKPSLHRLCRLLGLPSPPTVVVDGADDLSNASAQLGFPVVLKLPEGNNSEGRMYCDDDLQLRQAFDLVSVDQKRIGGGLPFVQKKIQGDLVCTLCFCSNGRKLGEVVYRSLRTLPESGGTSVYRQSIVHPEISRIADRLISASHWSGFVGFDFLVEQETGIPYVIDANVRANPAIHLGYCAGLDWTQLILDLANDQSPEKQTARSGINVRTALLDIVWLLEGFFPQTSRPKGFSRRLREFLSPDWPVHSRGDLIDTKETASAAILGMQAIYSGLKSLVTGRSAATIMLDHANYDSFAATKYRSERPNLQRERIAA